MYLPREDSWFFAEILDNYLKISSNNVKILDMGSGSGILAKTCSDLGFKNVLAADIDDEAVRELKKQKIKAVQSDLFSNIKGKYDLILFNAPYLPEDKYDAGIDTTAGKKGYEIILRFLGQSKKHLSSGGSILLLFSSLSRPKIILREAKKLGFDYKLIEKKSMGFFEKLFIYDFFF